MQNDLEVGFGPTAEPAMSSDSLEFRRPIQQHGMLWLLHRDRWLLRKPRLPEAVHKVVARSVVAERHGFHPMADREMRIAY